MKIKVKVGNGLLAASMLFLASCAPAPQIDEGDILQVPPGGAPAWQMKQNRTGPDHCQIGGNQLVKVTRKTYWSPYTGSGDSDVTDLVEINVKDRGSCDDLRSIFLKTDNAGKLEKQNSRTSPEGGRSPGQNK